MNTAQASQEICVEWRDESGYHEEYVQPDKLDDLWERLWSSGFYGRVWIDGALNWMEL